MAIPAAAVAKKIVNYMNKNNITSFSVPWSDFYALVERGAIRDAFLNDLKEALKKESVLISYGQAVVGIMKDYSPPNIRHDFS
ncbi:hypothetical protein [Acidithiobacillus ferrivorans]|uniref:hypothetical protein n=1 Tax=Acidithiobacillus ferrivorans TaxID=160808 RepID=UPI001C07826C|nr:hypothetical protein [Acidithiobacillus ferrivorans]MBU2851647.1 hypothetical protein [Acidithiobacillus ferrivorans]